nr:capsule biosynthesis protein CapA-like [Pocillopora verrucosa]
MNLKIICFVVTMTCAVLGKEDEVTLLFVGDISFAGPIKYYVDHKYHTYNDTFNDVAPFIREADISVGNLESPFANQHVLNHLYRGKKPVLLYAIPKAASALRFAGFDVMTIANNHLNDLGGVGANFTTEVLEKTGIKYFGISLGKYDSSQEPLIIKRERITIAFLGYCAIPSTKKNCSEMRKLFNSGPAIYQDDIATRDIRRLKKAKVDIIVAFMHYGEELTLGPVSSQKHINKHLMSLGVDMIIGAHPHVLQDHCLRDDKLIAYSLGNFLFHTNQPPSAVDPNVYGMFGKKPNKQLIKKYEHFVLGNCDALKLSRMLKVTVSRKGVVGAKYLPLKVAFDEENKRLHPEPTKNAKWITVCGAEDQHCKCLKN